MSLQIVRRFTGGVRACWITTYNIDLGLFDGFLYSRLGDPPLNVTVLADGRRHDEALAAIAPDEAWRIDRINRRWLLRPVHHHGAFHPKTLLFVDDAQTTLLVGSGNLSYNGIDGGHEIFSELTDQTPAGKAAIAAWTGWMARLVDRIDDRQLRRRFGDLRPKLPSPQGPTGGFVHNLDRPILTQLLDDPPADVVAIHATAPFFDPPLHALTQLAQRFPAASLHLYLANRTKVDGQFLIHLAERHRGQIQLHRYGPADFVHAKMIGLVAANGRGQLLSGSANLSAAALTHTATDGHHGNVEAAILADLDADQIVAAFTDPEQLDASPVDLDAFAQHRADYEDDEDNEAAPCQLRSAERQLDGSIHLHGSVDGGPVELVDPTVEPYTGWHVSTGAETVTIDQLSQLQGRLLWLTDTAGQPVSNRVIVAEGHQLEQQLQERTGTSSRQPSELTSYDLDTPLGAILQHVHQNYLMDISETDAVSNAERAAGTDDHEGSGDPEVWEQLARDTLAYDPRATTYRRAAHRLDNDQPVLQLLAMMLARSPEDVRVRFSNVIPFPVPDDESTSGDIDEDRVIHHWSDAARIRVRARNVLGRWADAIGDERLLWLDPTAPSVNLQVMVDSIAVLTSINRSPQGSGLSDSDLSMLVERVVTATLSIWPTLPDEVRASLPAHTSDTLTALVALELQHGPGHRERVLAWQPKLTALRRQGLVAATPSAAFYLGVIFERPTTESALRDLLDDAENFLDDPEWIRRTEQQLDVRGLKLERPAPGQPLDILIRVSSLPRPLADPRTLQLVGALRDYRACDRIALYNVEEGWRLVLIPDENLTLKAKWVEHEDGFVESTEPLSVERLEQLIEDRSSLAELFLPEHRAA
jgi:hypothetical protein